MWESKSCVFRVYLFCVDMHGLNKFIVFVLLQAGEGVCMYLKG